VVERLEAAQYPVADVEAIERGDLQEIVATLVSTAVEAKELDRVVADLRQQPRVRHATWESSTKD
jgi:putative Mg2+ transporter-C (MgtC) family protein